MSDMLKSNNRSNVLSILGLNEIFDQIVPITELKRNIKDVMVKLEENHTLYLMKNSNVLAVLMEKNTLDVLKTLINDQQNYIEDLENQVSVLKSKIEIGRSSHEDILKILNE